MIRLQIDNVSACYGRKQVLFDVSLPSVADGTVLGLLGPNASGKSTFMRRLSRELGGQGHIRLDGRDQADISREHWLDLVASMPQSPPAPTALTPTELMWSTARALAMSLSDVELAETVEEIFAGLGLTDFAMAPLHTLSGGKRQLVGLALALIRNPQFLLLDEPTSALDLHWRMVVLELVRARIKSQGGVAIAALHDLDIAAEYCDTLALLDGGRVIAAGTPAEVLTADNLARVYHVEADVTHTRAGRLRVDVVRPIAG